MEAEAGEDHVENNCPQHFAGDDAAEVKSFAGVIRVLRGGGYCVRLGFVTRTGKSFYRCCDSKSRECRQ